MVPWGVQNGAAGDQDDIVGGGGKRTAVATEGFAKSALGARAKRRLREAFRRHRGAFAASTDDVVLIARRPILNAPWNHVIDELLKLAGRAGLIPSSRP